MIARDVLARSVGVHEDMIMRQDTMKRVLQYFGLSMKDPCKEQREDNVNNDDNEVQEYTDPLIESLVMWAADIRPDVSSAFTNAFKDMEEEWELLQEAVEAASNGNVALAARTMRRWQIKYSKQDDEDEDDEDVMAIDMLNTECETEESKLEITEEDEKSDMKNSKRLEEDDARCERIISKLKILASEFASCARRCGQESSSDVKKKTQIDMESVLLGIRHTCKDIMSLTCSSSTASQHVVLAVSDLIQRVLSVQPKSNFFFGQRMVSKTPSKSSEPENAQIYLDSQHTCTILINALMQSKIPSNIAVLDTDTVLSLLEHGIDFLAVKEYHDDTPDDIALYDNKSIASNVIKSIVRASAKSYDVLSSVVKRVRDESDNIIAEAAALLYYLHAQFEHISVSVRFVYLCV